MKRCGVLVELQDENQAIIWNNEKPVHKKYTAYITNGKQKETGEKRLIPSDTKLKILGFIK